MAKNINNLDKSLKQNITPADIGAATSSSVTTVSNNIGTLSNLQTSEKGSLVGAINELFQSANNGKELIANAIGEPLSSNDTFSAMSSDINSLLSTFKTNMMNNGISVESGDKFKSLIDKITTLTDNEGKGVQIANGITKTALATKAFSNAVGSYTTSYSYIEIRNLTFVPQIILAFAQNGYGGYNTFTMYNTFSMYPERVYIVLSQPGGTAGGSVKVAIHANSCNIDSTGFTIPVYTYGTTSEDCYWVAVGVGEEDTTLRDSLASILTKEGVSVAEEDSMASLITKVDEEFDENRNKLYNLMLNGGYEVNSSMNMDSLLELLSLSGISSSDIKQIACGWYHTFILKNDGSLWACGRNSYGQLGLNNTTNRSTFTQVTTNINNDVKQIACGYEHTIILKNDGSIWCCGLNGNGQLGLNNTTNKTTFTQVTTNVNNDVKQIACGGYYTIIIKNDGSIWSCGGNGGGQLGLNNTTDKSTFTQVTTNINNDVKQIVCGQYHTMMLKNDGSVWVCGLNNYGQLGLGNTTNQTSLTQVTTNINNDVKQIACGNYHVFILKNDGSVWSCGRNSHGQLGLGTSDDNVHSTFTQVTTNINNDVKQVACGTYHTVIIKNDGSMWGCGRNANGDLGLGDTTNRKTFTQVTTNINNDVKQIACGEYYTFIIKNDGGIWSTGGNSSGQLGLNNTTDRNKFNMIPRGLY